MTSEGWTVTRETLPCHLQRAEDQPWPNLQRKVRCTGICHVGQRKLWWNGLGWKGFRKIHEDLGDKSWKKPTASIAKLVSDGSSQNTNLKNLRWQFRSNHGPWMDRGYLWRTGNQAAIHVATWAIRGYSAPFNILRCPIWITPQPCPSPLSNSISSMVWWYSLVICYVGIETMAIFSEFSHYKRWLSLAMLVYQRVLYILATIRSIVMVWFHDTIW